MSMFKLKCNQDEMLEMLSSQLMFAEEAVTAGVYATFQDTGFFASSRHVVIGYVGLTNRNRLIAIRAGMLKTEPFSTDLSYITKIKVKKTLFGMWQVYLEYFAERAYKLKFTVSPKILGAKFPNQRANTDYLIQTLQGCSPAGR
ncbi:MAG: hypothetical protein K5705_10170 [Oscillospiraceae bacterium]|nr:hypothetical protein [Oscillospiraceae bacterium]MCR4760613.1 hypothetical protein [Oscillospiraceae bacterium]